MRYRRMNRRLRALLICRRPVGAPPFGGPPAHSASAALAQDLNWARLHGCPAGGSREPLRESAQLDRAAGRLAAGESLRSALTEAGYFARQSAAVHLSGGVNDAQVARTLVDSYCLTLASPGLREFGALRRGRDVWFVLAAALPVPSTADAPAVDRLILDIVNEARAAGRRCGARTYPAVAPLSLDPLLSAAALEHSLDMARHGEFEHRGHDGSTPAIRVRRAGYGPYRLVGENIAAGAMTALEVARGWLASPEHCENIMDARFTQIGIGYAVNLDSDSSVYWTQVFAAPRR